MYLSSCVLHVPGDSVSSIVGGSEVKSSMEGDAPEGVVEIWIDLLPQRDPCCWTIHLNGRNGTYTYSAAPQSARRIAATKGGGSSYHVVIKLQRLVSYGKSMPRRHKSNPTSPPVGCRVSAALGRVSFGDYLTICRFSPTP